MVLLKLIERRVWASIVVGIPAFLAVLVHELGTHFMTSPETELLLGEILTKEIALNTSLEESVIKVPLLLWWTPFSLRETSEIECDENVKCVLSRDRNLLQHPTTKAIFFYGTDFDTADVPLPRRKGDSINSDVIDVCNVKLNCRP